MRQHNRNSKSFFTSVSKKLFSICFATVRLKQLNGFPIIPFLENTFENHPSIFGEYEVKMKPNKPVLKKEYILDARSEMLLSIILLFASFFPFPPVLSFKRPFKIQFSNIYDSLSYYTICV